MEGEEEEEGSAGNADNELYIANIGASPMGLGHYCIPGLYTLGNYTNLCTLLSTHVVQLATLLLCTVSSTV